MKNIVLNEKQFDLFLRNKIHESLSLPNGVEEGDEYVQNVLDYLKDTYNSTDDERKDKRNNLRQLAGINKVNFDYSDDEFGKRQNDIVKGKNEEIKEWVAEYLPLLRSCWNGKNFMKSKEVAKYSTDKGTYNSQTPKGVYDKLSGKDKENVINLASFLDKNRLTCIYREFQKQPSVKTSCGLDLTDDSINCNTPIDVLMRNLDFSASVNNTDELLSMYDGTRVKNFNQEVGFNDDKRHIDNPDEWAKIAEVAAEKLNERRAKLYLMSTYGMNLDFGKGNKMFKFGNSKVADDTLIINFSSAIRCPAWNECIMKDACYAKTSEVMYDNTFNSNLKKNLIWEQTKVDTQLMKLMMALLRSYLLNYVRLPFVGDVKEKEEKKKFIWELCQKSLYEIRDEYGAEAIDVLKSTRNGNLIRLNENGDFIGQWLVDAFEQFAAELKLVDINIAAYTCRALNYEAVENLILNISQQGLVKNQNSKAFAHFFYAIDPKDYARLGETYGGPNYTLDINPKTGKITPVYRRLIDENGELKGYYYKCPCGRGKYEYIPYIPKANETKYTVISVDGIKMDDNTHCFYGPTYINGKEYDASKIKNHFVFDRKNNIFYIKNGGSKSYRIISDEEANFDYGTELPMTIVTSSPKIFVDVNEDKIYRRVSSKNEGAKVADCYMCRICYARDAEGGVKYEGGAREEVPVYVFVATHGANKNEFQDPKGRLIAGKSAKEWAETLRNNAQQSELTESIIEDTEQETPQNDKLAIKCVVRNFVDSVRSRMAGRDVKLNEIKSMFDDFLSRINGIR